MLDVDRWVSSINKEITCGLLLCSRYVLISHYQLYDRLYRSCNIILMIACVWLFSFSMMVPPLLGIWGKLGLDPDTFSCTILKKEGKSPKKFLFVFGILVPCAVITFCYACIFVRVRKSRLNLLAHRCGKIIIDEHCTIYVRNRMFHVTAHACCVHVN